MTPLTGPNLYVWMALRRAHGGGVTKVAGSYVDHGRLVPCFLLEVFDELIRSGLLVAAEADAAGLRRVSKTDAGQSRYAELRRAQLARSIPQPQFPRAPDRSPDEHSPAHPAPVAGRAPLSAPAVRWARCPDDGRLHAMKPDDVALMASRGYGEALCGHKLPTNVMLEMLEEGPSGALCLPCVIGATADLPDPGQMGTAF